jgi:bifunctional non-homologous end joining protein LigD
VRLITKGGYDWTKRFPWIVEAALKNRHKQFVIDGEAVILGVMGTPISTPCTPASTMRGSSFAPSTCSQLTGPTCEILPLSMRKANLAQLVARRPDGIFLSDFEQGEIGPDLFVAACDMGLEGMVSKRRDRPYQAGRSKHWVKVKNQKHPAISRVIEALS